MAHGFPAGTAITPTAPVRVRPGKPGDSAALLTLIRKYWQFDAIAGFSTAHIEPVVRELLAGSERGSVWVADRDGELVGYLIAASVLSVECGGAMAEIDEFFVVPEARSRRIGTHLLAAAEAALADRGCARVELDLSTRNGGARRFYARMGYLARSDWELLGKPLGRPR